MKKLLSTLALAILPAATCSAVTYAIDIDTQRIGTTDTSSTINTATGFFSMDATTDSAAANVTVGGVNFSLGSTPGPNNSRNRGAVNSLTDLTRDFVFEDGPNAAIIMFLGGAGSLAAGTWQIEVWSSDNTANPIDPVLVGLRVDTPGPGTAVDLITPISFTGSQTAPFVTTFVSDGVSAYDVFIREANINDRARLNAVRLTSIPEPASAALLVGSIGAFLLRHRR